ncbi:MAG: cold shock domain-containing protein [Halobacteria archaeon]|nr:cold shock domain-containing protein [Halobacteria archaeon]
MPTGTIKFYHDKKGYGFIEIEGQEDDVFFHISDVEGMYRPSEGDEVEFEIEEDAEGDRDEGSRAVGVEAV